MTSEALDILKKLNYFFSFQMSIEHNVYILNVGFKHGTHDVCN